MKEDLTLEEISGHAIDVVGAGVDTVRLIIVIILMMMVMIMIITISYTEGNRKEKQAQRPRTGNLDIVADG